MRAHVVLACAIAALVAASAPSPAHAQSPPPDPALARIDSLIEAGRITEAQARFAEWESTNTNNASLSSDVRAHTRFLRARLAANWSDAEQAYLGVALTYPTTVHAPLALLRLGQGLLAAADAGEQGAATRALGYLERLTTDYPRAHYRAEALLWLARAQRANGRANVACHTLQNAAATSAGDHVQQLIRFDAETCSNGLNLDAQPPSALFAVQTGAFRERESADDLVRRLETQGFDARVATIEGGMIFRVRVGSFSARADADAVATRLRIAGFETVIVDDVRYERVVR